MHFTLRWGTRPWGQGRKPEDRRPLAGSDSENETSTAGDDISENSLHPWTSFHGTATNARQMDRRRTSGMGARVGFEIRASDDGWAARLGLDLSPKGGGMLEVKMNGMVGFTWLIEITVYIQDQGRPKGHAPSVWPLRELALSWKVTAYWLILLTITEIDH